MSDLSVFCCRIHQITASAQGNRVRLLNTAFGRVGSRIERLPSIAAATSSAIRVESLCRELVRAHRSRMAATMRRIAESGEKLQVSAWRGALLVSGCFSDPDEGAPSSATGSKLPKAQSQR